MVDVNPWGLVEQENPCFIWMKQPVSVWIVFQWGRGHPLIRNSDCPPFFFK